MKKIFFSFIAILSLPSAYAASTPPVNCGNLPGCSDSATVGEAATYGIIGSAIETGIQYTAVLAVLAVMLGGIFYLISSGDEEKTKKAKNIIIWALVGVFISMLAYSLINIINNFRI